MRFLCMMLGIATMFLFGAAMAQTPPFPIVTITGNTEARFNRVSLFESGSARAPYKTELIGGYDGRYSISVAIPQDMHKKGEYYVADMRFWEDKNENGVRDQGEQASECHFIIWVPSQQILYMEVYRGSRYPFKSSVLNYRYHQ